VRRLLAEAQREQFGGGLELHRYGRASAALWIDRSFQSVSIRCTALRYAMIATVRQ
jgi:hypothetical protein